MKKIGICIFAVVMVVWIGAAGVFAATGQSKPSAAWKNGTGRCYADANQDGICDHYAENYGAGQGNGCGWGHGNGFHGGHHH